MVFSTNQVERARITSGGNLGLGTATPTAYSGCTTLAINNATTGSVIDLMQNGIVRAEILGTASVFELGTPGSIPIVFYTNNGEKVRIFANGNFGIGTGATDNGSRFQVSGAATFSSSVTATDLNVNRGGGAWQFIPSSGANVLYIKELTGNIEVVTIDGTNKRVGIGTTSPAAKLDVVGAAAFSSSVTASSFIKSGGTSSQYLMADGSVTTGGGGSVDELQVSLICQVFG